MGHPEADTIYSFPGIASIAAFTLNTTSPLGVTAFGSLFQIGWAFAIGIAFAIITCGPTSGGHFNPAITICFAIWQGFPWKKVPYYIFSQIFGAFIAGLLLMGMYWPEIAAFKAKTLAAGLPLNVNGGPASILCTFPNANQTNLGYLFMIEFFVDSFIVSLELSDHWSDCSLFLRVLLSGLLLTLPTRSSLLRAHLSLLEWHMRTWYGALPASLSLPTWPVTLELGL